MKLFASVLCSLLLSPYLLSPKEALSQTIPMQDLRHEQLRLQTLLEDSLFSPISLPFNQPHYEKKVGLDTHAENWWTRSIAGSRFTLPAGLQAGLHPFSLRNTYNSMLPSGENNQAAWYGRGITTELQTGLWLSSEYVSISLQPHFIWQQNRDFLYPAFLPRDGEGNIRYAAEGIGTHFGYHIDAPFRFGPDPYWTADWGNSSIRLHTGPFEAGLSSEPLWWGPSVRYPLMMSNNAPGIPHVFLGTREGLRVPYAGIFQFRWLVGYPQESKYHQGHTSGLTRFINALNVAWSPAFLETLTLGLTRTYHFYEQDGFDWANVMVMLDPFQKTQLTAAQGADGERQRRNQAATFYGRLAIPGSNAELYGEFYREDHSYDWRDFIQQPHQNSAWTIGFQKVFFAPLADFYKINLEITSLTITQIQQTRPQDYLYTHIRIRQGHTNKGQFLGAAIGPGSASQFIGIDAYHGNFKFGVTGQRVAHNDTFHLLNNNIADTPNQEFGDYYRHRVNLNLGVNFLYGPGPFYLTGSFIWTKAYNYGRFDYGRGQNLTNYGRKDLYNSQLQMGITYVF